MVGIPRDMFAPGGPFYKPGHDFKNKAKGSDGTFTPQPPPEQPQPVEPTPQPAEEPTGKTPWDLVEEAQGLGDKEASGVLGKGKQLPFIVYDTMTSAMRSLAKLVGFKKRPEDVPPPEVQEKAREISEAMNEIIREKFADEVAGGHFSAESHFDPEGMSMREVKAAMEGLSFMSATASAGERGLSALRWILKNTLRGHDGKPYDMRRVMRWAKHSLRRWVDEHREECGTQHGRFYYAAVNVTAGRGTAKVRHLTVLEASVLFVAAYELETGLDWDEVQHVGENDDLEPNDSELYSSDTDSLVAKFEPDAGPPGGKFNG
jgi:hypothetical protein